MIRYYKKHKELIWFWLSIPISLIIVTILYLLGLLDALSAKAEVIGKDSPVVIVSTISNTLCATVIMAACFHFTNKKKNKKGCYGN